MNLTFSAFGGTKEHEYTVVREKEDNDEENIFEKR